MRGINGVRLGSQVRQHVMTAPRLPLVAQGADVDRGHDDPLARAWRRFRKHPPIEVHDLAAARPRVRRIVPEARTLVRRHDVRQCSRSPGSGSRSTTSSSVPWHPMDPCTPRRARGLPHRWPQADGSPRGTASRSRSRSRSGRWECRQRETAARRTPPDRAGSSGPHTGSTC